MARTHQTVLAASVPPPPASRLDEDGKVLTPEELLYRVRGAVGGAGLLGQQLGTPA